MNEIDKFLNRFDTTVSYKFYNDEVEIIYDWDKHKYLLVTEDGLVEQPSVTTILHKALDKSTVLIPWGCKMMGEKLLATLPHYFSQSKNAEWVSMPLDELTRLLEASKKAHEEKLEAAGNIGNIAHNWLEQYIKGLLNNRYIALTTHPEWPDNPLAANACTAALDWMKRHNIRWLRTEKKIYSRTHKYAGTMDGLVYADSCNDIKCCKSPFKDRLSIVDWKTSNYLYIDYLLQTAAYQAAYIEETGEPVEDRWVIRLGKETGEFQAWHCDVDTYHDDLFGFLNALRLYTNIVNLEVRMKDQLDRIRAIKKDEIRLFKEAALKVKCKGADKYKGVRYPVCNGGNPCEACLNKYNELHPVDNRPDNVVV